MKNEKTWNKIILSIGLLIISILFICGRMFFKEDYMPIFKTWEVLLIFGILFFPITSSIFTKFKTKGWFFSKFIGLTIAGYTMWLLAHFHVEYNTFNSYFIIFIFGILNVAFLIWKLRKKDLLNRNIKINWDSVFKFTKNVVIIEILLISCLFFWCDLKGRIPEVDNSTEKFMDYWLLDSIMDSKSMPPEDVWYSGNTVNYYYFGQFIMGFLCKVAGITARTRI